MLNEILNSFAVLFGLGCVCFCISALFTAARQIQMLQQNSYFPKRYTAWIKENEVNRFFTKAAIFVLFSCMDIRKSVAITRWFCVFSFVYMLISIVLAVKTYKKSVIKLNFTARIKRMYFVYALALTGIALLQIFVAKADYYWYLSLAFLLALLPYLAVYMLWAIMYPAERIITKHYINDAKKILASFGKRLKVVGVTGSYGKTGTKQILYKMLSEKYNTLVTPKNFNTPMGVVRAIRENLTPETEVFVCEMGAKKAGDIKELCDLVNPVSGVITSVGPQHLDTFGDIRTVISTKFELYDAVKQANGTVYANFDNKLIRDRSITDDVCGYGTDLSLEYYADNIEMGENGQSFTLHLKQESVTVRTKLLGQHNILNIVGAAALAYNMGVSSKQIAFAVSRLEAASHRLEIKRYINGSTLIDDAYNANPEGCLEACRVLARFKNKKRIIVTPGLVELGEKEYECNFNLGKTAAECADVIILVGLKRSKPIAEGVKSADFNEKNLYTVASFKEAQELFAGMCDTNTVLLFENDLPDNYLK